MSNPMNIEPTASPDPAEPTPERRRRAEGVRGTAVRLGDGRDWTLADFIPTLTPAWDKLYDDAALDGTYQLADVRAAAWALLLCNYQLCPDEAARLIVGARP